MSAPPRPLWPQIFWLLLVNAAVSLAWLMYQLHLGKLLVAAGMSAGFAATLRPAPVGC